MSPSPARIVNDVLVPIDRPRHRKVMIGQGFVDTVARVRVGLGLGLGLEV